MFSSQDHATEDQLTEKYCRPMRCRHFHVAPMRRMRHLYARAVCRRESIQNSWQRVAARYVPLASCGFLDGAGCRCSYRIQLNVPRILSSSTRKGKFISEVFALIHWCPTGNGSKGKQRFIFSKKTAAEGQPIPNPVHRLRRRRCRLTIGGDTAQPSRRHL